MFKHILLNIMTPISCGSILFTKFKHTNNFILECNDDDRSATVNNVKYSPIIDSIRDDLIRRDYSCLSIAKPGSIITKVAYGRVYSVFSLANVLLYFLLKIVDKIARKKLRLSIYYEKSVYLRLLKTSKPSMVIGIQVSKQLVSACNSLNIPVVDVLHGYGVTLKHWHYGSDAMRDLPQNEVCSDYIALDKLSQKYIEKSLKMAHKNASVWSIQSPVLDSNRPFHVENMPYIKNTYSKVVCITLQWGIERYESRYPHTDGELHPKILEVIKNPKLNNVLFIIKPHPVINEDIRVLKMLEKGTLKFHNVVIDSTSSLYSIFHYTDVHITIFSTAVREAAIMGISSLIFSTDEQMFAGKNGKFKPEIENKIAIRVGNESTDKIVNIILFSRKKTEVVECYRNSIISENTSAIPVINSIISKRG
jgi:hypothetical protein